MHYDKKLDVCMVHAGIYPAWSIKKALAYASEVEATLQSTKSHEFFHHMYGDKPPRWSKDLKGWDRLRFITNAFTRMRYFDYKVNFIASFSLFNNFWNNIFSSFSAIYIF